MTDRRAIPSDIQVRRYIAGDVALIQPRLVVAHEWEEFDPAVKAGAVPPGEAWTIQTFGQPVGCGGLVPLGFGRFLAWTWFAEVAPRHRRFVSGICAAVVKDAFERQGARRIEAHTPLHHLLGRRFLERLGFQMEGVARAWGPDGSDYCTYARVK